MTPNQKRRQRHTPTEVSMHVECAARTLVRLHSPGCAWDYVPDEEDYGQADLFDADGMLDATPNEQRGTLRIARRGTKIIRRTSGVDGVRGLRHHNESDAGITPRVRGMDLTATALGFARLERVPEALLLAYAGDFQRWPLVRHAACSLRPGRAWQACVEDAGHRLMFARAVLPAADRAKELRERKGAVLALRRDAERLLIRWLEAASRAFLAAFSGYREPLCP